MVDLCAGVNILPNVRIRYPGTIIGHREESLSAQNADTDFFQTCYKMTKKNSKLQFQHIKNRNIHFKVSLYWMWTVITILIFVLHPFHDLANNLNYNSDKPLITPFLNNSLKSSKFLFVLMFLPTFIKNMNNFNSKIIKDWNSFKTRGTIKRFFSTFNKFIW